MICLALTIATATALHAPVTARFAIAPAARVASHHTASTTTQQHKHRLAAWSKDPARQQQRCSMPTMRLSSQLVAAASPAVVALDALGAGLKLTWRVAAVAVVGKLFMMALELPALAKVKTLVQSLIKPEGKKAAAKPAAAEETAAGSASSADMPLDTADAAARLDGLLDGTSAEEEEPAPPPKTPEEEAAEKAAAEKLAAELAAQAAAAKEAADKEAMEREAVQRAQAEKIAEEQKRFREKAEAAKALKEKLDAEAAAERKAKAEAAAAAAAAAEKEAEEAAKVFAAATAATAAEEAKVTGLLSEIAAGAAKGGPRILSFADAADKKGALVEALEALEAKYDSLEPLEPSVVREGLLGFWRSSITSSADEALSGMTGYGASSAAIAAGMTESAAVVAHFQSFSKKAPGSVLPSVQTVEVICDSSLVSTSVGALKGDFECAKSFPPGVNVVEGYTATEFGGSRDYNAQPAPRQWKVTYLSPSLRVSRVNDGTIWVHEKSDAETCTGEIADFMANPYTGDVAEAGGDDDGAASAPEDDDRPLWQRRLDDEKGNVDEGGGSSIP